MPKIPSTKKAKVAQYLLEFPNETFKSNGHVFKSEHNF